MNEKESKSAATIRRKRIQIGPANVMINRHKYLDDQFDPSVEEPECYAQEPLENAPPLMRLMLSNDWILFLGLLSFRTINALMIQTSYVPDEYWQSVEVAHNMAFDYGYMTWEWRVGLRGYSYPLIFATIYKVLGILHLDSRILLIKLPRLAQGVFAAIGDVYLYKLSRRLSGPATARLALLCQLTSWFTFYCCTRTLTNSMETVLTTVAMYYFPWPNLPRLSQYKYIFVVGLAVVVRPTAAIVWLPMCAWHVWMYRHVAWRVIKLFAEIGLAVLSLSSIVDRVWYGEWVYVHYNFLQFNVLSNMGAFYGSHPWHWYLTQGFVVLLGSHIFPFLMAARKGKQPAMLAVIVWTIAVYSALEHKEFRFLMPVLPLCMHISAVYLTSLCEDHEEMPGIEPPTQVTPASPSPATEPSPPSPPPPLQKKKKAAGIKRKKNLALMLIALNLPIAVYACLIHQRGTVDVMRFLYDHAQLQKEPAKWESGGGGEGEGGEGGRSPMEVMFLMPCHSTPFHSYVHENVSLQFLTCEPNLTHEPDYVDEADEFYQAPASWMENRYGHRPSNQLPTHLVLFNSLAPQLKPFLEIREDVYQQCATLFHTHFPDGRVGSHVLVFCRSDWLYPARKHKLAGKMNRRMTVELPAKTPIKM